MKQKKVDYGRVISVKDAQCLQDSMLPNAPAQQKQDISTFGNALWSYQQEHKINGIQVLKTDWDLPIDRQDLLFSAFQPVQIPRSIVFWMSPDDQDSIAKYDALLQDVYDGKAVIVDELKQYDPGKAKFMVWIRYNQVSYALHPRFSYLRQEVKNG